MASKVNWVHFDEGSHCFNILWQLGEVSGNFCKGG